MLSRLRLAVLAILGALCLMPPLAEAHGGGDESEPERPSAVTFHSDEASELPSELVTRAVAQAELLDPAPVAVAQEAELPETWCGTARTTDDTAHAASPGVPQIKVLYAYAADQPNRFADLAPRLQATVSLLSRFVAGQSGGRRTLRFDMGTSCGPNFVDVQTVALPNPLSYYVVSGAPQFPRVAADVRAAVGHAAHPRNLAVYADRMRGSGGVSGTGEFYFGDAAEAPDGAWHNEGGLLAAIWGRAAVPAGTYAEPATMLHEITHNLGAVQASAPHSTGTAGGNPAGHCFDEQDVMCYADGGSRNALTYTCPLRGGDVPETYDCGGDDYFNATPAAGSWLASHWNVYDSAFLGSCGGELVSACGATGAGDAYAPTNTTPVPPAGWVARWSVSLTGDDTESPPVASGQWRLDGGPITSSAALTVTSHGVHRIETRVADAAGNWSPWRSDVVRVDATPPSVGLSCAHTAEAVACRIRATDAGSGVKALSFSRDGTAARATGGAFRVPAGTRTVRAVAVDRVGRSSAALVRLRPGLDVVTVPLRDRLRRTVASPTVTVRAAGTAAVAHVSVPALRVAGGRWRTRMCARACRTFAAPARRGRLAARSASLRATARGTVRIEVARRSGGRWRAVLSGRRSLAGLAS